MYLINVNEQIVSVNRCQTDVAKTVGIKRVAFDFDNSWDGLKMFACFKNSNIDKECRVEIAFPYEVEIPQEVLSISGTLYVGALGVNDKGTVKPTIWCMLSNVVNGVPTNVYA